VLRLQRTSMSTRCVCRNTAGRVLRETGRTTQRVMLRSCHVRVRALQGCS
jgi:RNase P protein component